MGFTVSDQIILNIVKEGRSPFLVEWAVEHGTFRGEGFLTSLAETVLDLVESDPSKITWAFPAMNSARAWPQNSSLARRLYMLLDRGGHPDFLIRAITQADTAALETLLRVADGSDLQVAGSAADLLPEFPNGMALLCERIEKRPQLADHMESPLLLLLGSGWTARSVAAALARLARVDRDDCDSDDYDEAMYALGATDIRCAFVANPNDWAEALTEECAPLVSRDLAARIARSLNKGKGTGAIEALRGAIPTGWLENPKIPDEPGAALARCILQVFGSQPGIRERLAKSNAKIACGIIAGAIAILIEQEASLDGDPATADLSTALKALCWPKRLRRREELWIARVASFGAEAVGPLIRLLDTAETDNVFERVLNTLGKISHESAFQALLSFQSKASWRVHRVNELVETLNRSWLMPLDLASIRAALADNDDETALKVLGRWSNPRHPANELADAVLPYAERLAFSDLEFNSFMEFVLAHPDPRFLPLADLWRPGENLLGQMAIVLLRIHQPADVRLAEMLSDSDRVRNEALKFARESIENPRTIRLPLRCSQCDAVYHYEIKELMASIDVMNKHDSHLPLDEFVRIDDVIVCKRCDSIDDYTFTDKAERLFYLQGSLLALKREEADQGESPGAVQFVRTSSTVGDGLTNSEILARLEERIAGNPDDRAPQLARANTFFNMRKLKQALEAFTQILKRWPDYSEAAYQRGQVLARLKRYAEALEDFRSAALSLKPSDANAEALEDVLRELLRKSARAAGKPVPMDAMDALDAVWNALPEETQPAPFPRRQIPEPAGNLDSFDDNFATAPSTGGEDDDDFDDEEYDDEGDEDEYSDETSMARHRIADDAHRRVSRELVEKIMIFGKRYVPESDWDQAASRWQGRRTRFEAYLDSEIRSVKDQAQFALFIDYRIHDWRPTPDAKTLAQKYKEEEWPRLTRAEQSQLVHWLERRRRGLYEVEAIDESRHVSTLRDYFSGETFEAYDHTLARVASKGQLFVTAVFPCGPRVEISVAMTEVQRHIRFSMERWLRNDLQKWQSDRTPEMDNGWPRFFSEQAAEIEREIFRLIELPPLVVLSTGEPPTPSDVVYEVLDRRTVRTALENWNSLIYIERGQGNEIEGESFDYIRNPGDGPLPFARPLPTEEQAGGRNILTMGAHNIGTGGIAQIGAEPIGSVLLGENLLEVHSGSKERVDFLRGELESRVPSGLRFLRESRQEDGLVDRLWEKKKAGIDPEYDHDPQDKELAGAFLAQHMRAWIDLPIPALQGRTPRQAAADPASRREVENLLRDFEYRAAHSRSPDSIELIEIRRIRTELELS